MYERLVFDNDISEEWPVIQGTWITVEHIVERITQGYSWADIMRHHPELTKDDIRAAVQYFCEKRGVNE